MRLGRSRYQRSQGTATGARAVDAASAPQTYRDVVLEDAPVAYWRLADMGATASDERARLTGTYEGTCTRQATGALVGDPDPAVYFDGTCAIRFTEQLPFQGQAPFSVELWVDLDMVGGVQPYIMNELRSGQNPLAGYAMLEGSGGGSYFERTAEGVNRVTARPILPLDGFSYLVGVYDGAVIQLFLNAQPLGNPNMSMTAMDTTGALLVIGAYPAGFGNPHLFGTLDEIAVYDHVLSPERIALHYMIGTLGPQ